jgi:hypothetical protein
MITLSPGGLYGFYMLGVCHYLKENYYINTEHQYIYSGASAGAWNSMVMSYKGNITEFVNNILKIDFSNAQSILEWEYILRDHILNYYTLDDFNLEKVYISITTLSIIKDFSIFKLNTEIYSDFTSLLDFLDCCITSSHIPFITGGLFNLYKNKLAYDGGFIQNPFVKNVSTVLNISPKMWSKHLDYDELTNLIRKNKPNITELYLSGYEDTKLNSYLLDKVFKKK